MAKKVSALWKQLTHRISSKKGSTDSEACTLDMEEDRQSSLSVSLYAAGKGLRRWFQRAWEAAYRFCYVTGVQTIRFQRHVGNRLTRWLAPPCRAVWAVIDRLVLQRIRRFLDELARIRYGFWLAGQRLRLAARKHPLLVIPQLVQLPVLFVRRHRRLLTGFVNVAAPVAAAIVLVTVVQSYLGAHYALAVEYAGQPLGYIKEEAVFDSAALMAQSRVIDGDGSFAIHREPRLTLAVVPENAVLDEAAVADKILHSSVNAVVEASGLYIDGRFEGAVLSRMELEDLLTDIKDSYKSGDANERIEFIQEVTVEEGLYPLSSTVSAEQMKARLTAKDANGQPYLGVEKHCTIVYQEPIPYTSVTVQDTSKYLGYTGVKVKGQNGIRSVTADVVYVNGVEVSRTILNTEVIKEPVQEVIAKGAYRPNPNAKAGVPTGKFIWPLPSCKRISSGYGRRWGRMHTGIDISGNGVYGRDIIAADSGRVVSVVKSGYGGGLGLHIVISHGNGYSTLYAHCSKVLVNVGDRVTQGQVIGKVGSTGNSTGPHLHFEIWINGNPVNPLPYLNR